MARFGRSRANTDDSNSFNNADSGVIDSEQISGFAASVAAGGVAAGMIPPSGQPRPSGGASASGGGSNSNSNKRGGQKKQKSITSGISTLFRRQPSPDFGDDFGNNNAIAAPSLLTAAAANSASGGRSRDPSGVHATRGRASSNDFAKKMTKRGSKKSRSKSRGAADSSGAEQQPQQQQQQYSQAQRDLLHGTGAYTHPHQTAATAQPAAHASTPGDNINSPALSTSLSGGTSLSREMSFQNSRSLPQNNQNQPHPSSTSYDDTHTSAGAFIEESGGTYSKDDRGRSYDSSASDRGQSGGQRSRSRNRSTSRSRNNKNRDPHNITLKREQLRLPRRYRGFSTSISSLFLDESIVCGAFSCCGLLLSSRTEHLLNERNVKRGLTRRGVGGAVGRGKEGGRRAPSRILGIAYVVSILGVLVTYSIWGFEDQDEAAGSREWYDEYDDYNENNEQNDNNNDDGNANANYDYNAQNDDGNGNNVDDGMNDNQNNDDANGYQQQDDLYQDDIYNRKLLNDEKKKLAAQSGASSEKHSFNGIMKLRDHQEYIFDPAVGFASQTYTGLKSVFEDNGLSKTAQLDRQLDQHQRTFRKLEDDTGTSDFDNGQQVRTVIVILFLFMLGVIGRRRRMRTRFAILRSRAQDDHLYYASVLTKNGTGASGSLATPDNTVMENFHEREDKYDGACSHTLFGCYPADTISADYADYNDDDETIDDATLGDESTVGTIAKKKRRGGDFMGRLLSTIFNCCCGKLCSCWCQFFSICALAQEAREARLLLPPSMQSIDLITHQPFHEYAKDVNNVRRRFMEHANQTWVQHYAALSHLSRYILLGSVLIVVMTMILHPMGGFGWGDAIVLIATFTQSFLVLAIVFGIFHRSDLSLDAVVKLFAVGFVICVPVGFVLEGILINGFFSLIYAGYYMLHWMIGDDFDVWMSDNHRWVWMAGELVNAYVIAAGVEELCKYYGFRFIEHPDLLFLTGLDRSAQQAQGSGGIDSYKFDSQLVSEFSAKSYESDCESIDSRGRKKRSNRRRKMLQDDEEEEPDLRSLQQQAAAITTGMISVAVGLACAENFFYVFFLGGTGGDSGAIAGELAILIFRSIFPVHALSAAMQSINMIRKFIEEKHGGKSHIGVGRIIFPAVLLHGTFDAILMCVNSYIEASWDNYYENGGGDDDATYQEPYNSLAVNLTAAFGVIGVMVASFGWYTYQNKLQTRRLMTYEARTHAKYARNGFSSPELV